MKKIILFILAILLFNTTNAQDAPPEMFKFQAVITNKKGKPINNQMVGVEISIYQNAINGILVYSEIFNPMTSSNGIINLEIGNGVPTFGMFSDILWGTGTFFMEVKVDVKGGSNYVSIGASQLLSVPYALFSKYAISLAGPDDIDDQNEIQTLSLEGNVLRLTDGGEVTLPENTGNFVFYYADKDADGFGDPWNVVYADVSPSGYVTNPDDCNDDDASINPAATEIPEDGIDQNCDGIELYLDKDADGFTSDVDCDDLDATVYPGAEEVCDGKDNDCDGAVDNDCVIDDCQGLLISVIQYSLDNCESGFDLQCWSESPNYDQLFFCLDATCLIQLSSTLPSDIFEWTVEDIADYFISNCGAFDEDSDGFAPVEGDCDDFDPTIYPGAPEICDDGIDQDCNGSDKLCNDEDNDGFVDINFGGDDCDDTNPSVNPEGFEECDGLDNDCDGEVDNIGEHNEENIYYIDQDGDGWGSDSNIVYSCVAVEGYVFGISGDCDDTNPDVYPLAEELCDGIDNNCDGLIDEVCDVDGDGVNIVDGDCDDNDPTVYPGAEELCGDNIDNNCDGQIDETCDIDADSDGFSINDGDCDDNDPTVYPGADELCGDGIDNNCDGTIDEDCLDDSFEPNQSPQEATPLELDFQFDANACDEDWYLFTIPAGQTVTINLLLSQTIPDLDLYLLNSEMTVVGSSIDTDLDEIIIYTNDGVSDTFFVGITSFNGNYDGCMLYNLQANASLSDQDGDGFTSDVDCDDTNSNIYPGALEIVGNGVDEDCDGHDACYFDNDQDGYGSDVIVSDLEDDGCLPSQGTSFISGDCDDNDASVYPGATELCDGVDNNCDGTVDEGCNSSQIDELRNFPDGPLNYFLTDVLVTYIIENEGFTIQENSGGPALYIYIPTYATILNTIAVGDRVSFAVTEMSTFQGMRQAILIEAFVINSNGNNWQGLVQEVSNVPDLVFDLDNYETELITVSGVIASAFDAQNIALFETNAIVGDPNLKIRLPSNLVPTFPPGSTVIIESVPLWRFNQSTLIWVRNEEEIIINE